MNLSWWHWAFVFGYLAVCIGGALYLGRYVTDVSTFLVAGRKVRKFLITSTGSSTEVGIVAMVMMSQEAYVNGPIAMTFPILVVITFAITGLTGFCVYRLRQSRALTLGHYAEMRYGSRAFRVFTGIPLAIAGVSTIAMFPAVAGTFFTFFLGLSKEQTILGFTISTPALIAATLLFVIMSYTLVSGSVGVIFSDLMQAIIIWATLFVTTFWVANDVSWAQIVDRFGASENTGLLNPLRSPSYGWSWLVFMFLQGLYGAIVWPPICARILSVRAPKVSKQMYLLTGAMQPARTGMIMLMGFGAAIAVSASDLPAASEVLLNNPSLAAMPIYISQLLPPTLIALFIAALLSAHVGTVNSYGLAWSGVLTQDLILPLIKKNLSQKAQVRINQLVLAILTVIIFVFAITFSLTDTLFTFIMLSAATYCSGAAAFLTCGVYWKGANKIGAWCAMILGMMLPLASIVITGFCSAAFVERIENSGWLGQSLVDLKWVGICSYVMAFGGMIFGSLIGRAFLTSEALNPGESAAAASAHLPVEVRSRT